MTHSDWYYLAVLCLAYLSLGIIAMRTAPREAQEPEYVPEAPTIPPAIIVHLAVSDRLQDRAWDNASNVAYQVNPEKQRAMTEQELSKIWERAANRKWN